MDVLTLSPGLAKRPDTQPPPARKRPRDAVSDSDSSSSSEGTLVASSPVRASAPPAKRPRLDDPQAATQTTDADDASPCSICLDPPGADVFTLAACEHVYCRECIATWARRMTTSVVLNEAIKATCPACRAEIAADDVAALMTIKHASGRSDRKLCPVRGCRATVVDLRRHAQRMHIMVQCDTCGAIVEQFRMRAHQKTVCRQRLQKCPLEACAAMLTAEAADTFVERYFIKDPLLAADLRAHHRCLGVRTCAACDPPTYHLASDDFATHHTETHGA